MLTGRCFLSLNSLELTNMIVYEGKAYRSTRFLVNFNCTVLYIAKRAGDELPLVVYAVTGDETTDPIPWVDSLAEFKRTFIPMEKKA